MKTNTLFARSSILVGMLSALAACGDIDSSGGVGADEIVEVDQNSEIVDDNASVMVEAHDEEAPADDSVGAPAGEAAETVSVKLHESGVFIDMSADQTAQLPADEEAVLDGIQDENTKTATGCNAATGTTNWNVGDSCSMCKEYSWYCGGNRRRYWGTVELRSDGLYCVGSSVQWPSCC